jgi:hypothetical protein
MLYYIYGVNMNYDHRFIFNSEDGDKLVLNISDDLIDMEVVIDGDTVGRASLNVDEWVAAIMLGNI